MYANIQFVQAGDESGRSEEFTKNEVFRRIRNGQDFFFVTSNDAADLPHLTTTRTANVISGRTPLDHEFTKTLVDETHEDNLFALPTCSNCESYARGHTFTEAHDDEDSANTEPRQSVSGSCSPDDD